MIPRRSVLRRSNNYSFPGQLPAEAGSVPGVENPTQAAVAYIRSNEYVRCFCPPPFFIEVRTESPQTIL